MINILKDIWVEIGAIGVLLFVLIFLSLKLSDHINKLTISHKNERNEMRKEIIDQSKIVLSVIERNSNIMSELCVLIKSKIRNE